MAHYLFAGDEGRAAERFNQEARSVAKVSHPNVVTVIDALGHPYRFAQATAGRTHCLRGR